MDILAGDTNIPLLLFKMHGDNNGSIYSTVLPAKSDSDVMFLLQSYQGLIIDSSLVLILSTG